MMGQMRLVDESSPPMVRRERAAELILSERVEACNAEAAELLGYPHGDLVGTPLASLLPAAQPDGIASQAEFDRHRVAGRVDLPQCFLWQFRRRDGDGVDVLVHLELHPEHAGWVSLRLRDISSLRRVDRALEASEARLRQVLENTTAVVFIKDATGRYSYVNRRFCEMFQRSESELIGGYDSDVFPPEVVARLRADDRRVLQQGTPMEIEEHLIVDGRPCTYLATKFPLLDDHGRAYAICGIATDITRRKRSEEALRSAALAVSTAEGDALYQELTRYLATTLGVECCFIAECTSAENTHVRTLAVYTESGYEENIEYALPGTACGTVVGQDFRLVPEGVRRMYPEDRMFKRLAIESYAAYPLNDSHGRALGLIAVLSQRTLADRELVESMLKIFAARAAAEIERTRTEDARRVSEESYRAIFEAAEDAIFVHDWDTGAIIDANPKACQHYGYDGEEIKRIRIGDISSGVYPYVEEEALRLIDEAKRGKPLRFEWHRKSRDGSLHWDEVCLKSAVIAGKQRVLAFTREITERKLAEDALRRGALAVSAAGGENVFEELVRALATILDVDIAFVALPITGQPSRLRMLAFYSDGRMIRDFEYPIAGTPCETVVGQQYRVYPSALARHFPEDTDFKTWGLDSYAGLPLNDVHGNSIGIISVLSRKPIANPGLFESMLKIFSARVVTEIERTRASQELRNSEEQYRTIFNASLDGMIMWSAEGGVVDVNPAFLAMHGYSRDEVLDRNPSMFIPPESKEIFQALLANVGAGRPFRSDALSLRKDGSHFFVEVHGSPISYKGKPHLLAMLRDITERKQREEALRRSEEQLRQAQKMEAIGHLTGGIAHDFNNILTSIMGYIVLAAERQGSLEDPKLGKYLEQARLASTRARDLIQQMLTFSRGQRGEPRALSLPPLIKETVKLLRSTLAATVEIETDLDGEVPAVLLDPVQVEQVLMNLCINARDAMRGSGTIRVSVRTVEAVDCTCTSCRKRVQAKRMVELAVRDTGSGIRPEVLERMFEPFFSTKEVGKGSGMGLATVHGIVHEYGGHVVVDTAPGKGTEFRILFDALSQDNVPARKVSRTRSNGQKNRARLTGRVLVVEDERLVAEFMGELLKTWGLEVTVKNNPVEACELVASGPERFDLVITDQTMPKLTGLELACKVTELRPGLPVILYTGYCEDLAQDKLARCGVRALVKKPLDPEVLMSTLRANLPVGREHV
jgi:PAS domain S-box-containing protein